MLSDQHGLDRYSEWLDRIEHAETQDAFRFLVCAAACVRGLRCHAQLKGPTGPLHDFRFLDSGDQQPFSFITNQNKGLLFYFRTPAVRSGRYSLETLKASFESAAENSRGEWTVRIEDVEQARRLWRYLGIE
jgi:hypothetical protein